MKISDYRIGTLGSHSSLQILKGARDEGFKNLIIAEKGKAHIYRAFRVADEIIEVDSFKEVDKLEQRLIDEKVIMVPHGSFFSAFKDLDALIASNSLYFGNKQILPWEENREKQRDWLKKAGLKLPKIYNKPEDIDGPVIIKFFGAGGGKGFFLAKNPEEFYKKFEPHEKKRYIIQEYIVGAPIYVHYFYSPLNDELEIMSMDKRYETNVDSIGRISAKDQLDLDIESSYNIMGNIPVVIRERFLPELFNMADRVIKVSRDLEPGGLIGPFCLETIITPEMDIYVFEISARIVAGTNPYIGGSPYADLRYPEPMSTGRRVAREIKEAIESNQLEKVLG